MGRSSGVLQRAYGERERERASGTLRATLTCSLRLPMFPFVPHCGLGIGVLDSGFPVKCY